MRAVVYTSLALAVCVVLTWTLYMNSQPMDGEAANRWLAVAGMIVAGAALSQVVFAVIAYLEATMLRTQIEELRRAALKDHRAQVAELGVVKDLYYQATKHLIQGLIEASYDLPADQQPALHRRFQRMQVQADLAHGTHLSLLKAMQTVFKLDSKSFGTFGEQLFERSAHLPQKERVQLKKQFYALLKNVVTS